MKTRKYSVPAKQDSQGDVSGEKRAATLKLAVGNRVLPETVRLLAVWNAVTKSWDLEFTDEEPPT